MPSVKPTSIHVPEAILDRIQAIADRHGLSRNAVIVRFIEAGIDANPTVTDAELRTARARRAGTVQRGAGLVIPLPPLARSDETAGADGGMEERGIEPSTSGRRSSRASDRAALRLVAA